MPLSRFNQLIDKIFIAKGGIGASKHYLTPKDADILTNKTAYSGSGITIPKSTTLSPLHQGQLHMSNMLSTKVKKVIVLPQLTNSSLISMGQFFDDAYEVKLTKEQLIVTKKHCCIARPT